LLPAQPLQHPNSNVQSGPAVAYAPCIAEIDVRTAPAKHFDQFQLLDSEAVDFSKYQNGGEEALVEGMVDMVRICAGVAQRLHGANDVS
jgi:hypothetical protein